MIFSMSNEVAKKAAAEEAITLIHDGMKVGLGTGTTTHFFIEKLIERCREGLRIKVIASSDRSRRQAEQGGIPLLDSQTIHTLDLYIDSADEIDPQKRMIKGGGGALLREKIVASMSREMVVIIDESKLSAQLGNHPLPIEVIPFAIGSTLHKLDLLGYQGSLRQGPDHSPFITENHNFIYDIQLDPNRSHPELDHQQILSIPGVVETGFFFNMAGRIVIGYNDGRVVIH